MPRLHRRPTPLPRSRAAKLISFAALRYAGPDIFISYHMRTAGSYAEALGKLLQARGFRCFVCEEDQPPGDKLARYEREAARSRMFVLVGTQGALDSPHIARELSAYADGHSGFWKRRWARIVPVNIAGQLDEFHDPRLAERFKATPWEALVELVSEPESASAFARANPSRSVVDRIEQSYRQLRAGLLLLLGAATIAAVLVVGTGVPAIWAYGRMTSANQRLTVTRDSIGIARAELDRSVSANAAMLDSLKRTRLSLSEAEKDRVAAAAERDTAIRTREAAETAAAAAVAERYAALRDRDAARDSAAAASALAKHAQERADSSLLLARSSEQNTRAMDLAIMSADQQEQDPTVALRLALESMAISPTPGAKRVVLQAWNGNDQFYSHAFRNAAYADLRPDGRSVALIERSARPGSYLVSLDDSARIRLEHGSETPVGIRFVLGGERVVTWTEEGTVAFWDRDGTRLQTTRTSVLTTTAGTPLEVCPSGEVVLAAEADKIHVWNAREGSHRVIDTRGTGEANEPVETLRCRQDERSFLVRARGHPAYVWTLDGSVVSRIPVRDGESSLEAEFSPQGGSIAVAHDSTVGIWGRGDSPRWLRAHNGSVIALRFSRDGRYLLSYATDGETRVYPINAGKAGAGKVLASSAERPRVLEVSNDSRAVAIARGDGVVSIYDMEGRLLHRLRGYPTDRRYYGGILRIVWSADDTSLLTLDDEGAARVWRLNQRRPLVFPDTPDRNAFAVHVSPASGTVAVLVAHDSGVDTEVYNARGVKQAAFGPVYAPEVEFSSDGRMLLLEAYDRTYIWREGAAPVVLTPSDEGEYFGGNLAFSAGGDTVLYRGDSTLVARAWAAAGVPLPIRHADDEEFAALEERRSRDSPSSCDRAAHVWTPEGGGYFVRSEDGRNQFWLGARLRHSDTGGISAHDDEGDPEDYTIQIGCLGSDYLQISGGIGIEVFLVNVDIVMAHLKDLAIASLDDESRRVFGLLPTESALESSTSVPTTEPRMR